LGLGLAGGGGGGGRRRRLLLERAAARRARAALRASAARRRPPTCRARSVQTRDTTAGSAVQHQPFGSPAARQRGAGQRWVDPIPGEGRCLSHPEYSSCWQRLADAGATGEPAGREGHLVHAGAGEKAEGTPRRRRGGGGPAEENRELTIHTACEGYQDHLCWTARAVLHALSELLPLWQHTRHEIPRERVVHVRP
ncbi:unnamed protein product, partial [Prorocentrum cordatum]